MPPPGPQAPAPHGREPDSGEIRREPDSGQFRREPDSGEIRRGPGGGQFRREQDSGEIRRGLDSGAVRREPGSGPGRDTGVTAVARAAAPVPAVALTEPAGRVARPPVPVAAPDDVLEELQDQDGRERPTARSEMREQRRLRMVAIVLAILVLLGALPLYFGIRAATRDPVLTSLDDLQVPGWAAVAKEDAVNGSRWCLIDCRFRERTVESQGTPDETAKVYETALGDTGWQRWDAATLCPEQPVEGHYTCWKRDELTLDLWVRGPSCAADPLQQRPAVAPTETAAPQAECTGSVVSVKVRNAIADDRIKPGPSTDPSLTGEDPDPVFTDDPLLDPAPSPS